MLWLSEIFIGEQRRSIAHYENAARKARADTFAAVFSTISHGFKKAIQAVSDRYQARKRRRQATEDLSRLTDRLLADVGLTRVDLRQLEAGHWPQRRVEDAPLEGKIVRKLPAASANDDSAVQLDLKRAA